MKRLAVIVGSVLAAFSVLLVVAWSMRLTLIDWGLQRYLASQGRTAEVTVAEFSPRHLLLTSIASDGIAAREVLVRFSPLELLSGRLEEVRVEGLRAQFDLTSAGGGQAAALPPLPPIHLSDSRLDLKTPQGPLAVTLEGRIAEHDQILAARLYLTVESTFGNFQGPLDASLTRDLEPRMVELDLSSEDLRYGGKGFGPGVVKLLIQDGKAQAKLYLEDERNPLRVEAAALSYSPLSGLSLEAAGDLSEDSALWSLAPLPGLSASGRFSGQIALPRLPAGFTPPTGPAGTIRLLLANEATSGFSLDLENLTAEGSPRPVNARLTLDQDRQGAAFDLIFGSDESPTRISANGHIAPQEQTFRGEVEFEGRAALDHALLAPLLPDAAEGALSFSGSLQALLPEATPKDLPALQALAPTGRLHLEAEGVGYSGRFRQASGGLAFSLDATAKEAIGLTIEKGGRVEVLVDPAIPLPVPLQPDLPLALTVEDTLALTLRQEEDGHGFVAVTNATLSQGEAQVTLAGPIVGELDEAGRFRRLASDRIEAAASGLSPKEGFLLKAADYSGSFSYKEDAALFSGTLEIETALDSFQGLTTQSAGLQGEVRGSYRERKLELLVAQGAEATLDAPLEMAGRSLSLAAPVRLGETRLGMSQGLDSLSGSLELPAIRLSGGLALNAAEGGKVTFDLADNLLTADARLPNLALTGQDAELSGISLSADLLYDRLPEIVNAAETAPLRVTIDRISHPQAPPVSLDLAARQDEENLAFSGSLGLPGGKAQSPIAGSWNRKTGEIKARLENSNLIFSRSGLQPADLSPQLARLQDAFGEVAAGADLSLTDGRLRASGTVDFRGVSFTTQGTKVRGLTGLVELSDLFAPRSKGTQTLTAESIDPAVPIRGVTARFSLEPGDDGTPLILIESIEGASDFGPVLISDGRISPLSQEGSLRVTFPSLDLSQLTALLGVEGLSASGTLRGSIPVALRGGVVVIDQGSLDDSVEGVIRYDSPTARQALVGGGDSVTLMLDALENFQYQDFGVTLDKPSSNELTIGFYLEGKNPDVLDGYPFRFNITLSTDPTSLLQALRLGSDIGKLLLDRTGTFPSSNP
jgi:hypothetical protein